MKNPLARFRRTQKLTTAIGIVAGAVILMLSACGAGPSQPPGVADPPPAVTSDPPVTSTTTEPSSTLEPSTPQLAQIERDIAEQVNRIREEKQLGRLTTDPALSELARAHSCRMAREGSFGHVGPAEMSVPARLRATGKTYEIVGENVAKTIDVERPVEAAMQGWMNSPGHRANILRAGFTHTGVGACVQEGAYFFTQIFLRPAA
jgi:uncharacterized protein YkwD